VYRDAIFQASAAEKPQGTASPLRGHLCVLGATARTRRSREGSNAKTWENGGAGDTAVGSRPQRRWCERGSDKQWKGCIYLARPRNTYRTPLAQDGYPSSAPATHEFAAKAAAVYFAKHRRESSTRLCGRQVLLSEKRVGAPAANSASEQIPLQLKPHR
jgi:hypothetical protein